MISNKYSYVGTWIIPNESRIQSRSSGLLNIKQTGETLQCSWEIVRDGNQHEYMGIGMIVENKLFVSRFSSQAEGGGIGLYRPIGDFRSNSALWASSKRPELLGSGIAIREATSSEIDGSYRVRYFLPGMESPVYTVIISKRDYSNLYLLSWLLQDKPHLHGVGMVYDDQLVFAWGDLGIDYDLVIYAIEDELLKGNCVLEKSQFISKEQFVRKSK
jgi:hypothetical protein